MSGLSFYISPLNLTVTGLQPTLIILPETFSGDVTANVTWPANTFNRLFPVITGSQKYTSELSQMTFLGSSSLVAGNDDFATQNVFPLMTNTSITYGTNSGLITSTMTSTTIADEYLCYLNNKINGAVGQSDILNVSSYTTTLNTSINTAITSYLQSVLYSPTNSASPNKDTNISYLIYSKILLSDLTRFGGNTVAAGLEDGLSKNLLKSGDIMYFQCTIATESSIFDSTGNTIPDRTYLVKITLT